MAETKEMKQQLEQTTPVSYNLCDIPFDENYKLNRGSISQLIRGVQYMESKLTEPNNDYQKELYPALKSIVDKIIKKYDVLLQYTSDIEKEIKRYNLHGYNGKLKNPVSTSGVKYNLVYKFSNFGDYLKTITQRMKYLIERNLPQRYITNPSEGTAYASLKIELQDFVKFLSEDIDQLWNTAVSVARTAGGNSVQENLRKRTENREIKIQKSVKKTTVYKQDSEQQSTNRGRSSQRGIGRGRGGFKISRGSNRNVRTTREQRTANNSC